MRILWYSNAPWSKSGYGIQTRLITQALSQLGHKLAVMCNYGLAGGPLGSDEGVRYYPNGYTAHGNDVIQAHADDFKADVIVSMYDAWPLHFQRLKTPWIAWAPVDHDPAPQIVIDALRPANRVVSYSWFGQREFERVGIKADYIPCGVETHLYTPGDKAEARERVGLPQGVFIAGMVGANTGYPCRKNIPQALAAFATFAREHRGAVMYLHTEEQGIQSGVRLKPLIDALQLGPDALRLCDQYQYTLGFPDSYMVDLYRSMDVLLSPSMGEGFGIPIAEAQACGTPVIVCDATSMPELVGGGWLIRPSDLERWWDVQGAWQVVPHERAIVDALHRAAECKSRPDEYARYQARARAKAMDYDLAAVVAPAWDRYLHDWQAARE